MFIEFWQGQEGKQYTKRNPQNPKEMDALYLRDYGTTRSEMNKRFLDKLPRDLKILEVGCNIGVQLVMLYEMGFRHLYGVDVQLLEEPSCFGFNLAPAQALPFRDKSMDLVFTSGLLIHIPPGDLLRVMKEMYRVTRRYIWGFEYGAITTTPIEYQGQGGLLWAGNYRGIFRAHFDVEVVSTQRYKFRDTDKYSVMYLLEKHG